MTKNLGKLDDLLNRFQKVVDDGKYKRIPYTQWKKLKTADKCKAKIVTDETTGSQFAQIIRKEDDKIVLEFPVKDQSFGEFLSTEILIGGIDNMPTKDNDTLDQMIHTWVTTNEGPGYYDSYRDKLVYNPGNTATSTSSSNADYNRSISSNDYYNTYGFTGSSISTGSAYVTKSEFDEALATKEDKKPLKLEKTKENDKMKGFNFDFGPCTNNAVKMSLYGLAVKNSTGTWVSYDPKSETIVDVDILNFDGAKYLYKMPVAIKDIAVGDVVVHMGKPMFVVGSSSKSLNVVDPISGEKKEVMLTRSPFGFDFATKIVNIIGNMSADADNPFGNIWMFALASGDDKNNSGDGKDNSFADLAPLMLMNQGNLNIDPMMMLLLCGDRKDNLLPLMFMMNKTNTPAHTCKCGEHCECDKADAKA